MPEYRLRFAKDNSVKFLSHLELIRAIERSLRRAQLEMAYSEGFHPHPKISFGPALAVGISSNDEYFDVQLVKDYDPDHIKDKLNHALPQGIRILELKKIHHHVKPLNAIINRASYRILLRTGPERVADTIGFLRRLPERNEIIVERRNKDGSKDVNIRPWLHNVNAEAFEDGQVEVVLTGEIGSGGNLRPDEVVALIDPPVETADIRRNGLWHEDKGHVMKALDFCG